MINLYYINFNFFLASISCFGETPYRFNYMLVLFIATVAFISIISLTYAFVFRRRVMSTRQQQQQANIMVRIYPTTGATMVASGSYVEEVDDQFSKNSSALCKYYILLTGFCN